MIASLYRIMTISRNTLTEAVRQRVLSVLLIFGLILIGSSVFVSSVATPGLDASGLFEEQIKFVKDFGCGAMGLIGFAIALLSTAQLIPQELHNRTIYSILAKPVRRAEFLLGKFFGVVLLLALCVALMSLAFAAALYWQESQGIGFARDLHDQQLANGHYTPEQIRSLDASYNTDVQTIVAKVRDPQLIEAVLLIFAKLVMTSAIALLLSTFATSSIFTIVTTFMIYLIGHMESVACAMWLGRGAETTIWQSGLVGFISMIIPDMNSFTIVDEILADNRIPWSHTFSLLGYAGIYVIVLLALSEISFRFREI
jgi:ABC-type transport system involved in multi-copper enzyme maturation permease subunit